MPRTFRFAVKLPREITHVRKLAGALGPFERFLGEIVPLGDKLGPLLMQLPPSLGFDEAVAGAFLDAVRSRYDGQLACEPRHASWFAGAADGLLADHEVARVAADPARVPGAELPGGWPGLVYRRLHGSPRVYYSAYGSERLDVLAGTVVAKTGESWCIFDNTAGGAALGDANGLLERLRPE